MKQIMIHYGELSTKGRNRKMFQNKMAEHIRYKTRDIEKLKILPHHDFMHLFWEETPYEVIIEILQSVPGIQRFEPVYPVEKHLEAIQAKALELFQSIELASGDSFKVVAKRSDKSFEYETIEIQREVGGYLSDAYPDLIVDLKHPTHKLVVSIQQESAFLSLQSYPGMAGLPYGSSGKGLLMLSGGFDSPIAGYEVIKRGMALEMVHFASPPYTSPQALEKAKRLTAVLAKYGTSMTFHEVPFAEIQLAIRDHVPDNLSMTVMRRIMLRIMEMLLKERKAMAIVNGESLGQVASQTLQSMSVINEVTHSLILRPLITVDKNDIIDLAEKIGTYSISNEPFEDCCTVFAPKSPWTKPRLHTVKEYEAQMPIDELVKDAVANIKSSQIDANYQSEARAAFADLL
ncbi:tRNA 4-thiouridine(8) synthase ThiI [Facklamia sp. DSM 111018]|uniref:Probable tRNA sulfurtransferase n=1 Tax=Facklamia lactis TaxID=2749967 RepID=A0ABS0LNH4_9LACT|nr:tRNA uracil 4-sulfurtransferase ThiI [Facklamia lactis]MBG9979662.1 tRNA 4-thiouridine(8) synthase ThiI [Facklamia lactis]MBG9985658.1 tRNA 4-thiouridine(8) synthase ThiI [Facklamia lactis]